MKTDGLRRLGPEGLLIVSLIAASSSSAGAQPVASWTVDASPSVVIGRLDGPEEYILTNPLAGVVLSDGTIVIQNSLHGLFELRYYDRGGEYRRTVSRWGEGPYEFHRTLGLHVLPSDSILAVGHDGRFAVFGPAGERVREGRFGLNHLLPFLSSFQIDELHLGLIKPLGMGMPPLGEYRPRFLVLAFNLETERVDTIATVSGRSTYNESIGNGGVMGYPTPFGPAGYADGADGQVWISESDTRSVRAFRPGRQAPTTAIELSEPPRKVVAADRERVRDVYSDIFSDEMQQRWARFSKSMDFPDRMPFHGKLRTDRLGNLWIQDYEPPGAEGPQHWEVYTPSGRDIASVTIPETAVPYCFRLGPIDCPLGINGILDIGEDYLLVHQRDDLGVARVAKYRLHR